MGQKQGFFNLLKHLMINFVWLCSIMEIYLFFLKCSCTSPIFRNIFLSIRYGTKCSQPIRLQDFLINHISRTNQWDSQILCKLTQIYMKQKFIKKCLGGHGKNACGLSGHGTLKLTQSQEWTGGMSWFFACWCKFMKVKSHFNVFCMGMVKNGNWHLVHKTLKSALS